MRDGGQSRLAECLTAWPALCETLRDGDPIWWTDANFKKIEDLIRTEALATLEARARELEDAHQLPDYAIRRKRSLLDQWTEKWANANRRSGLQGALNEAGEMILEDEPACKLMGSHWASAFSAQLCNHAKASELFVKFAERLPEHSRWTLPEHEFMDLLDKLIDSGPGPDGIRYSCWTNARYRIKQILYIAYRYCWRDFRYHQTSTSLSSSCCQRVINGKTSNALCASRPTLALLVYPIPMARSLQSASNIVWRLLWQGGQLVNKLALSAVVIC